jgi:hypothetical protein
LALSPDETAFVEPETGLRNIEEMQMVETEKVRARIDIDKARERISTIETPILVMGRDDDHLQGIFRVTYELLAEAKKRVDWVSWDHDLHGYVFPLRGPSGEYEVNDVAEAAISGVLDYLDEHL